MIKVQNGVQPCGANPEQSSVEARNPEGIEASNKAFEVVECLLSVVEDAAAELPLISASKFIAAIKSDAATSIENGTAKSKGISMKKSMVKRINKIDATRNAKPDSARCILSLVTTIILCHLNQ